MSLCLNVNGAIKFGAKNQPSKDCSLFKRKIRERGLRKKSGRK